MRPLLLLLLLAACKWPAPQLDFEPTGEEQLARGTYLAEHVAICTPCHSERDWGHYSGPVIPGTEGGGGGNATDLFVLPPEVVMHGSNITPHALAEWSDGELVRALRGGLGREGEALFLSMPYNNYRLLSEADLQAVVAWVRRLDPVEHEVPDTDWVWPFLRDVVAGFPSPSTSPKRQPEPGTVANGRYVAKLASCLWCHSPVDAVGWPLPGRFWSGGQCFPVYEPGAGRVCSPNITPHATGIGRWSREQFIARFRTMTPEHVRTWQTQPGGFNSPMAWSAYSGMSEQDLGDLFDFLQTLPPVKNEVVVWQPE